MRARPSQSSEGGSGGGSAGRTAIDDPGHDDESPRVPGFRTWRGVYFFVFAVFVLVVAALAVFTRVYA